MPPTSPPEPKRKTRKPVKAKGANSEPSMTNDRETRPANAPLAGIRVVDFGRFIAGPYAAMLLADFGAEVIRVERRDGGEDRRVGPVTDSGDGSLFLNLNRNKRGMT